MEKVTKTSLLHPESHIIQKEKERNNRELGGRGKQLGIENDNEGKWRETEQSNFLNLSF